MSLTKISRLLSRSRTAAGFGSGVIVSPEGLILTAGHVVNTGASQFEIFFPGGQTATARLLGYNLNVDAAMLKLEGSGPWPFVELGHQATLKRGDWVVCLGHSGGYELRSKTAGPNGSCFGLSR
jgi:serine protease Do